jgi:hypothetical protein
MKDLHLHIACPWPLQTFLYTKCIVPHLKVKVRATRQYAYGDVVFWRRADAGPNVAGLSNLELANHRHTGTC